MIPLIARMITASQHLPAKQIALVQSPFLFSNPSRMRVRSRSSFFPFSKRERSKRAANPPTFVLAARTDDCTRPIAQQLLLALPSDKISTFDLARRESASTWPRHRNTTRGTTSQVAFGGAFMSAKRVRLSADGITSWNGCRATWARREDEFPS